MSSTALIDRITHDPGTDEFVLYLIEDGPWPGAGEDWSACLKRIQTRVYDALDVAIDGHLAEKFPESRGKAVRIQLDSPSGLPQQLAELVLRFNQHIGGNSEQRVASESSSNITGLRIVTGHELGRFQTKVKPTGQ